MIYLIFGQNSLEASKKIQEIKKLFFKKSPGFLFEEVDGDDGETHNNFLKLLENQSLFSQNRLLVFKNVISKIKNGEKLLLKHSNFLKESKDVFLFWEQGLKKDEKVFEIFKNNAVKIQETKAEKKDLKISQPNSIFRFVDNIFFSDGIGSLLHLEGAKSSGIDAKSLTNVIFWKLKKMSKKNKQVLDLAHHTILTDLNLKMDSKNEEEHISRLAVRVASKV